MRRAVISEWLDSYRIPAEVPKALYGAVVPRDVHGSGPYGSDTYGSGGSARVTVRTLHTLLVRSPVETIVLVDEGDLDLGAEIALEASDEWSVGNGSIEIDQHRRRDVHTEFSSLTSIQRLDACPSQLEIATWLTLLAPGVRLLPIRVRRNTTASSSHFGAQLGRLLADAKVAVVAASMLTRYGPAHSFVPAGVGPGGEAWLTENDTRLVQRIRALDAEGVLTENAAQRNAENPNAIAIAVGSARPRDSWSGHVIEYTDTHSESDAPIFTDGVGMVGIVF